MKYFSINEDLGAQWINLINSVRGSYNYIHGYEDGTKFKFGKNQDFKAKAQRAASKNENKK